MPVALFAARLGIRSLKHWDFVSLTAIADYLMLPSAPHVAYVPAVQLIRWRVERFSFSGRVTPRPRAWPWRCEFVPRLAGQNAGRHLSSGSADENPASPGSMTRAGGPGCLGMPTPSRKEARG